MAADNERLEKEGCISEESFYARISNSPVPIFIQKEERKNYYDFCCKIMYNYFTLPMKETSDWFILPRYDKISDLKAAVNNFIDKLVCNGKNKEEMADFICDTIYAVKDYKSEMFRKAYESVGKQLRAILQDS